MGKNAEWRRGENRGLECLEMFSGDKGSFFQFKEDLERFSKAAERLTIQFEKKLMLCFSKNMIDCVNHLYDAKRFQVDCAIGKYTKQEIVKRQTHGMDIMKQCLGLSYSRKIAYKKLVREMEERGKPLLAFLERYKKELTDLYLQSIPFVWHVSAIPDVEVLNPSFQRENMYYNEICDAVFATSNYNEILLYIGRSSGNEMAVQGHICLYKNNPFDTWDDAGICLKEKANVYFLNSDGFEPVIDFVKNNGEIRLKFGHEWIYQGKVPVYKSEQISSVPTKDMMSYRLFYGRKQISLAPYIDNLKAESSFGKIEDNLQKMVDSGIISFINLQKRNP